MGTAVKPSSSNWTKKIHSDFPPRGNGMAPEKTRKRILLALQVLKNALRKEMKH